MGSRDSLFKHPLQALAVVLACGACSSGASDSPVTSGSSVPPFGNGEGPAPAPAALANGAASDPNPAQQASPAVSASPSTSEPGVSPDLTLTPPPSSAGGGDPNAMAMGGGDSDPGSEPAATDGDGTDGSTANGGEAPSPIPSAKCGMGGTSPSFNLPNTLFSVPPGYDGVTPLPVVMAFHAAGNPNTQLQGILGATLQNNYIVFYPKSDGNGWSDGVDKPKIDAMFAALDATACYDKNRVFATGHSSGAQFVVQRLCAGESRWRAVATVASSVYCSSWQPIPALVIHGIGDTERQAYGLNDGDGLKDIVPYRTSNGCQESFTEVPVDGCTSGGVQVNPGCRDFNGCGETTRWCQHNDPQYGTSHHGVPCFGARVIKQFLDTYQ
jgi:polyhydroxybutyrate depolymerase